jgi:hypothetical protein
MDRLQLRDLGRDKGKFIDLRRVQRTRDQSAEYVEVDIVIHVGRAQRGCSHNITHLVVGIGEAILKLISRQLSVLDS